MLLSVVKTRHLLKRDQYAMLCWKGFLRSAFRMKIAYDNLNVMLQILLFFCPIQEGWFGGEKCSGTKFSSSRIIA